MLLRHKERGQTLLLLALTLLVVTLMAAMTLSITMRVRERLELQTVADTAAYSNAVTTARAFNTMGVTNRAIVSHWVVMLGIQANVAWASSVPAYFDTFADQLNEARWTNACADPDQESQRQHELITARNAFAHASLSLWNGAAAAGDDVSFNGCVTGSCWKRLNPGFGQLDDRVTQQVRRVRTSIRDLVEIQRHLHRDLQETLDSNTLANRIASMAMGDPSGQADPFPYKVARGAAAVSSEGVPQRPPGWREVSGALGTTREALQPMAHAIMGSRGNRFVMSGKLMNAAGHHYHPTPRRARIYATRIQRVLNDRFGAGTFTFSLKQGLMASYPESERDPESYGDVDEDEVFDALGELEDPTTGGDAEVEDAEPPVEPPAMYKVDRVIRVTPARSLGWDYSTGRAHGRLRIGYRSPCGYQGLGKSLIAVSRSHSRDGISERSQHQWLSGDGRRSDRTEDMTIERTLANQVIHHGSPLSHQRGYERVGHRPSPMCHPRHRHYAEIHDRDHQLGPEIDELGVAPGGFGFVFPQNVDDSVADSLGDDGAAGAFGQPKLPVLMTRRLSGNGIVEDPWNLTVNFNFSEGATFDMVKEGRQARMAALATGIAYYHRRCESHQNQAPNQRAVTPKANPDGCRSWKEPPNMLNPFWRATLVPINIDESSRRAVDDTPGSRYPNEAARMLRSEGLDPAARTYRLLKAEGYRGFQ